MVLVDTYGRILTQHDPDGDVRTAVVWVPGDNRFDWDDASDQQLVTLLNKYGYNDALTIEAGTQNVTVDTNGETETLTWDNTTKNFNVDFDPWQNGTANMFYRTVKVSNLNLKVLCDADGKAIRASFGEHQTAVFTVDNDGTEIDTITEGSSIAIANVITACGGATDVTNLSGGDDVELLVNGNYVQFINTVTNTTTPSVPGWTTIEIWADEECTIKPSGEVDHVFAQVRSTFGVNGGVQFGNTGELLSVDTPTSANPDDPYFITWYTDIVSASMSDPIVPGVYRLSSAFGAIDVTSYVTKFS